jgi:hypothetical protein
MGLVWTPHPHHIVSTTIIDKLVSKDRRMGGHDWYSSPLERLVLGFLLLPIEASGPH